MEVTELMLDSFREAWNDADDRGDVGNRVRAGLENTLPILVADVDAALTKVLSEHWHSYDSDCGEDYGCGCNAYTSPNYYSGSDELFEAHLKAKILEAINFD